MSRPRAGVRPRLVTLSSDVGSAYTAQMKAVLARSLDPGRVVDLANDLPAHSVEEAAFLVRAMAIGFPPGTVHVVVVDPGVGGRRLSIAIDCRDGSRLVGPDNGVLYPLASELGVRGAYRIETERLHRGRARVGTTFDGRDVFAPAAASLAEGLAPSALGRKVAPHELRIPEAHRRREGASGYVVHVDHFGNLVTNVPTDWIPAGTRRIKARIGQGPTRTLPFVTSYESLGPHRVGGLGSSFGTVELAVALGRASGRLGVGAGSPVDFRWRRAPRVG